VKYLELYELWCFLRLVRAGAEAFGVIDLDLRDLFVSDAAGGVTLATSAVTVSVGSGWKLCFQKQYTESSGLSLTTVAPIAAL